MADDPWATYRQGDAAKVAAPAAALAAAPAPAAAPAAATPTPAAAAPGDPWAGYKQGDAAKVATPSPAPAAGGVAAPAVAPSAWLDPNTKQPWKPSGNGLWDLLTQPVAKTEDPLSAARDYGLSAYDAATFGYGVPKALQSATTQAHANLGLMDYAASGLGYGLGPGKILGPLARGAVGLTGLGTEAGAGLAARLGGSMAAGGLEGTAAGAAGAAGHGGDASDIAQGAGMGLLAGAVGGAAGTSGPTPKGPAAADLLATAKQGYGTADNILYNNADIRQAMMNARNEIGQQPNRVTRLGQARL